MECGVMPKERIRKSCREGFADLLVQWGDDEIGAHQAYQHGSEDPRVRLFVIAPELRTGGMMFHPDDATAVSMNLEPGSSIGPVDIMLDREQLNRTIRVLRRARDQAYGKDE